ncbi:hypothetical protein HK102_006605, partial [Quaeritorhiza haematococci]
MSLLDLDDDPTSASNPAPPLQPSVNVSSPALADLNDVFGSGGFPAAAVETTASKSPTLTEGIAVGGGAADVGFAGFAGFSSAFSTTSDTLTAPAATDPFTSFAASSLSPQPVASPSPTVLAGNTENTPLPLSFASFDEKSSPAAVATTSAAAITSPSLSNPWAELNSPSPVTVASPSTQEPTVATSVTSITPDATPPPLPLPSAPASTSLDVFSGGDNKPATEVVATPTAFGSDLGGIEKDVWGSAAKTGDGVENVWGAGEESPTKTGTDDGVAKQEPERLEAKDPLEETKKEEEIKQKNDVLYENPVPVVPLIPDPISPSPEITLTTQPPTTQSETLTAATTTDATPKTDLPTNDDEEDDDFGDFEEFSDPVPPPPATTVVATAAPTATSTEPPKDTNTTEDDDDDFGDFDDFTSAEATTTIPVFAPAPVPVPAPVVEAAPITSKFSAFVQILADESTTDDIFKAALEKALSTALPPVANPPASLSTKAEGEGPNEPLLVEDDGDRDLGDAKNANSKLIVPNAVFAEQ